MRLCRSSHADMNGLTYSAANLARLMQWLIPVTMGLWALWTWSQEREQERLTRDSCYHASHSGCLFRTRQPAK